MEADTKLTRREVLAGAAAAASLITQSPSAGAQAPGILDLTAVEAVSALRAGKITSAELVGTAIDRRRAAGEDIGPLAGLPFVAKDNIDSDDLPTTNGSSALAGWQPRADAPVLAALRKAGGLLLSKTNMHEFANGVTSNNRFYGPVRNPYDRAMFPGGSSGGTGAAIAARLTTCGLGSDTGGSVRIPASLCGCAGFRPTSGRYPGAGIMPLSWTQDTPGPMARTVQDIILLDSICALDRISMSPARLARVRIGVPREYYYESLDPAVAAVAESTLTALRRAGAVLVEADIPGINGLIERTQLNVPFESLRALSAYLYAHGSRMSVIELLEKISDPSVRRNLQRQLGPEAVDAPTYLKAVNEARPALDETFARYFKDHDLRAMIIPSTLMPAQPITDDNTIELNGHRVGAFGMYIHNTVPGSAGGLPCLTFPAGRHGIRRSGSAGRRGALPRPRSRTGARAASPAGNLGTRDLAISPAAAPFTPSPGEREGHGVNRLSGPAAPTRLRSRPSACTTEVRCSRAGNSVKIYYLISNYLRTHP